MKKMFVGLLVCSFVMTVSATGALAQHKPMLATNGVELNPIDFEGGAYINSVGSAGNKIIVYSIDEVIRAKMLNNNGEQIWKTQISTNETGKKSDPRFVETSDGNLVFVWTDYRAGSDLPKLVFTKYDMSGSLLIAEKELTRGATLTKPQIAADDAEGFYLAYLFSGTKKLLVDRYDSSLTNAWTTYPNGLTGSTDKTRYKLISGGSGDDNHAFVVYSTNETTSEAIAAYITTTGVGSIIKDQSLGLKIEFFDALEMNNKFYVAYEVGGNIFMHKMGVDETGGLVVEVSQAKVCEDPSWQLIPKIATDGASLYICWMDDRNYQEGSGNDQDIYIQKVSTGGLVQWMTNGIPVTHAQGVKAYYMIGANGDYFISEQPMAYGASRMYVAWHDFRRDTTVVKNTVFSALTATKEADIFMQAVNVLDGSMLASDLIICGATKAQLLPAVFTSSPFIGWMDMRDYPTSVSEMGQRADNIPTSITALVTSPATANIRIQGAGFGCDPNYVNPDVARNSSYNCVKVNGATVEVTSWTTNEITVPLSYEALNPGTYTFEVTAYGDTGPAASFVKPSVNVTFRNIYFGTSAYTSGMIVPSAVTITGEVVSVYPLSSATINVNGITSPETLTNNAFSKVLSLSSGANVITIEAFDSYGGSGSTTCNVNVSSALTLTDATFDSKPYGKGDFVSAAASFKAKANSDYTITEATIGVGGATTDVMKYYDTSTKYFTIPLDKIGTFTGKIDLIMAVKDSNNNQASQTYSVEISAAATPQVKDLAASSVTGNSDGKIGFQYAGGGTVSGSSVAAAAASTVKIVFISPSGSAVYMNTPVTTGYNEVTIPSSMFDSNGLYIVKIYDGKKVIGTTRIAVLK